MMLVWGGETWYISRRAVPARVYAARRNLSILRRRWWRLCGDCEELVCETSVGPLTEVRGPIDPIIDDSIGM
jgi:hypothetical protein